MQSQAARKYFFINVDTQHASQTTNTGNTINVIPFDQNKITRIDLSEDVIIHKRLILERYAIVFNRGYSTGPVSTGLGIVPAQLMFYMSMQSGSTPLRTIGSNIDKKLSIHGAALPLEAASSSTPSATPTAGSSAQHFYNVDDIILFETAEPVVIRDLLLQFYLSPNYSLGTTTNGDGTFQNVVEASQMCFWFRVE